MEISEITGKISALKELKTQIVVAIRDEQEAQRMYEKMISQARAARTTEYSVIQEIKDQEKVHERRFNDILRNTEASITEFERKLTEEKRKKDEEQKLKEQLKRQEEQERRNKEERKRQEDEAQRKKREEWRRK